MMKYVAQFEHEVAGKVGRFILDHDTEITAAKEMCFAFLKHLGNIEDQVKAHNEAQKAKAAEEEAAKLAAAPQQEEEKVEEKPVEPEVPNG